MNINDILDSIDEETYDRYEQRAERHLIHGSDTLLDTLDVTCDDRLPRGGLRRYSDD